MLRDEDLISIFLRKHGTGVEPHANRRSVRRQFHCRRFELRACLLAKLRIFNVAGVAIRESKVQTLSRGVVKLVWRDIVAQLIASIFGKPKFLRDRMPIESDGVPYSGGKDLQPGTVGLHTVDQSMPVIRPTDI